MASVDLTGITEGEPNNFCDYCGTVLEDPDDAVHTLDRAGEVTLCLECYRRAGNSVR